MKGRPAASYVTNRQRLKENGPKHNEAKGGIRIYRFACGIHADKCNGVLHPFIGSKVHGSPEEAKRCIRRNEKGN